MSFPSRGLAGNDYHHVRSLLFSREKKHDTVKKGEPARFFCCVFLFLSIVFICGCASTVSDFTHAFNITSFASEHYVQNFCSMKDRSRQRTLFVPTQKKSVAWVAPSCSKPVLFCSLLFRVFLSSFFSAFFQVIGYFSFLFYLSPAGFCDKSDQFLRFRFSVE